MSQHQHPSKFRSKTFPAGSHILYTLNTLGDAKTWAISTPSVGGWREHESIGTAHFYTFSGGEGFKKMLQGIITIIKYIKYIK